jgi:hypothetical protein
MRLLGMAARIESAKVLPYLMKHGEKSKFYENLSSEIRSLYDSFGGRSSDAYEHRAIESRLITHTPEIEDWVLASILLNVEDKGKTIEELKDLVAHLRPEERKKIAEKLFEGKKMHEVNPKMTEIGSLTFSRIYDIGAYRDLHRQRGDRQQISPYSTNFGYHMPKEIGLIGQGMPERFKGLMHEAKRLHDDLKSERMHSAAQYAPVMANLIHHVTTMDPNQLFYQAQLRCQPAGADSYRTIALQEIKQGLEIMPALRGIIPFDNSPIYPLNRLPEAVKGEINRYTRI